MRLGKCFGSKHLLLQCTLYALLTVVRPCCSTVVFSGVVNATVTTKIKACGWRKVLIVQIGSIKSPPARSASGVIMRSCDVLLFMRVSVCGGGCLSRRSLFVIVG